MKLFKYFLYINFYFKSDVSFDLYLWQDLRKYLKLLFGAHWPWTWAHYTAAAKNIFLISGMSATIYKPSYAI